MINVDIKCKAEIINIKQNIEIMFTYRLPDTTR